jgi:protein SCO1/2
MVRSYPVLLFATLLLSTLWGCKQSTEVLDRHTQVYEVSGTIVATDPKRNEITLQHGAIPGFMEAMTMPYRIFPGTVVSELHPGDRIRARLQVDKSDDGDYHNARLDEIAVLAQSRPSFKPTSNYHVPTPGDAVPDFKLVDQSNKPVQLSHYQGKALLITFIYTRCPMNDFCPKMSRNFAAIDKALRSDPKLYAQSALLSISFDPAYDKPEVLRAYGATYTGQQGFEHWKFAAPVGDALKPVEEYFNLGATQDDANSITHSLSTVLIGPDGKIAAWYPGSEWTPEEVTAKMRSLVQPSTQQAVAGSHS